MIGIAFRRLARKNNMTVSDGWGYGSFRGYDTLLFEGIGTKTIIISGYWKEESKKEAFEKLLEGMDLMKKFRLQDCSVLADGLYLEFFDNPGTMRKLLACLDWLMPLLPEYDLLGSDYCSECGRRLEFNEPWVKVSDVLVRVHAECQEAVRKEAEESEEEFQRQMKLIEEEEERAALEEDMKSTVGKGITGAMLGALAGALLFAVFYMMGEYSVLFGFLISYLAHKCYDRFHGKKGRVKLITILIATVLGVLLAMLIGFVGAMVLLVFFEEMPGASYGDIPFLCIDALMDAEWREELVRDLLITAGAASFGLIYTIYDVWQYSQLKKKHEIG